ncbi:aminotransferase-like domain-containing protein [Hydrogenophaga aquatica]
MTAVRLTRYHQLAEELAESIRAGTLRAGDRLPSVRDLRRQRGVSPSTIFQAYAHLESQGLVEARPRSGHFVRPQRALRSRSMKAAPTTDRVTPVAISELVFDLLGSTRDVDVVPLGSAFPAPELFPFAELARSGARAMRRLLPAQVSGALTAGDETLRGQIRRRYALHGVPLQDDEPIITNGAMEALNLCLQAVTQPGDVVVVESPTFYAALQALERLHLNAVEVATDPVEGVDLNALEDLLKRQKVAACWFMPTFQNPLGALMSNARKEALVQLLARYQVPLIEDDVYAELHFGPRRPLPAKAFDREGLVLHCSSFSKCLAPGYRVGWAAAGRYSRHVERLKMMTSLATSIPSQLAIAEYLVQGGYDRHLRHLRGELESQHRAARALIQRHFPSGTRMTEPQGGYFVWLELPRNVNALAIDQQAMAHSISTAPGALFSADRRFTHHLRLNVGHPVDARFSEAARRLGALAAGVLKLPGIPAE